MIKKDREVYKMAGYLLDQHSGTGTYYNNIKNCWCLVGAIMVCSNALKHHPNYRKYGTESWWDTASPKKRQALIEKLKNL